MRFRDGSGRRSLRLPGWNYRQPGPYAITICTEQRIPWFGSVHEGVPTLSPAGEMVREIWLDMQVAFPAVTLDAFVIMPNHLHAIVLLDAGDIATNPELGTIVQRFKSVTTSEYAHRVREFGWEPFPGRLWQEHYYEHIVRDDRDLTRCRDYIEANPANWSSDPDHPDAPSPTTP